MMSRSASRKANSSASSARAAAVNRRCSILLPDWHEAIVGAGPHRLMMFQEAALFTWLTVLGNVLFGLKLSNGLQAAERREKAEYFLELVGLKRFMHSNVHELSGGMKQRVALARALAPNPRVLW